MAFIKNPSRTKEIRDQERHEYAFMNAMLLANKEVKAVDPTAPAMGVSRIRSVRQKWGKDLSVENYKVSDWAKIASLLPDHPAYAGVKANFTDSAWLKNFLQESRNEYNGHISRGNYPLSIVDPELSSMNVLPADVKSPYIVTKNGSLRELDADSVDIFRVNGAPLGSITNPDPELPFDLDSADVFVGWDGDKERELPGLSHALGAYLTQADAKTISRLFDPKAEFNREMVYRSVDLLRHLRSEGIEFDAVPALNDRPNQFEARIQGPDNTKLRIFDPTDNGEYIGRVYNKHNLYHARGFYPTKKGAPRQSMEWSSNDSFAILDYLAGRRNGRILKNANKDTSSIFVDGMTKGSYIHVAPHANRYSSVTFGSEEEAATFIADAIDNVNGYVRNELHFNELVERITERATTGEAFPVDDLFNLQDMNIYELQENLVADLEMVIDARTNGYLDSLTGVKLASLPNADFDVTDPDFESKLFDGVMHEFVGSYDEGFNPGFIVDNVRDGSRSNMRDALMAALKKSDYDLDKLRGNDFATNVIKDKLVKFDPESAKTIDEIDHPMIKLAMNRVYDNLSQNNMTGVDGAKPKVLIDDKGVIFWEANRKLNAKNQKQQLISGEIGQVMVPDENNIIKTDFASGANYGIVPGYTGYFSFDGDYGDDRMKRFRVKGFERTMLEQIDGVLRRQITQPFDKSLNNIAPDLDSSALNSLYHGDVYGTRVDIDFVEKSELKPEVAQAVLKTLSSRVRFENQYSEYATTSAETRELMNRDAGHVDESSFSYWKAAGEKNMRVLDEDLANYVDLTMTGTGKTQGLIWYLTDGAQINDDGSITPSAGVLGSDGKLHPDSTAVQKLDYFKHKNENAWDRNQMASNQLMTALKVDEGVNAALMSFGGWTFDDSYAVSKAFAERNYVEGVEPNPESIEELRSELGDLFEGVKSLDTIESKWRKEVLAEGVALITEIENLNASYVQIYSESEINEMPDMQDLQNKLVDFENEHGRFRPLQRGDKISDFGGNKGTIGIVIDPDMPLDEAKAQGLEKEVEFLKANPGLDVIGAPYSMLSRHNAGVVQELMDGEVADLIDPETGQTLPNGMGKMNFIITNLTVDHKTHAYSEDDIAEGKGRKASGQLAWALMSKDADHILTEIYGNNDNAWSTFREYLVVTGLDMKADGTLARGYHAQGSEMRNAFEFDPELSADEFLNQIRDKGGFLKLPFEVTNRAGDTISDLPVLSASLRKDTELIDGKMKRSDFTNSYLRIYDALRDNEKAQFKNKRVLNEETGQHQLVQIPVSEEEKASAYDKMVSTVQAEYNKIQDEIIERQFNGSHNGKHSFIRDKIMGKRMEHSATGVAIVDPRLNIGEAGMNADMMKALSVKEGDVVMAWRDPVLRDGAVRAMTVVQDDSVHGIAINPIADKSHDMDFDGDTMGIVKLSDPKAIKQLMDKFGHHSNMFDLGSGKEDDLYFQSGMDLATAEAKALENGDVAAIELKQKAIDQAKHNDPRVARQAVKTLTEYSHKMFREHGFGGDYVNLSNRDTVEASFKAMVDKGAKGNEGKLKELMEYFDNEKGPQDARDIQYATGVKSDDTGLAGGVSQKLVAAFRDSDIKAATELTYLVTQGTLQIKHDPDQARKINAELSGSLVNLYGGRSADGKSNKITKNQFKKEMTEVLSDRLGVGFNESYLDTVADMMSDKGTIQPIKDLAVSQGSPLDQVAYGGGFTRLVELADNNRSLLEGKRSQLFAPTKMRYATEDTVLAKKDTMDRSLEQDVKAAMQDLDGIFDDYARKESFAVRDSVSTMQKEAVVAQTVDDGPDL